MFINYKHKKYATIKAGAHALRLEWYLTESATLTLTHATRRSLGLVRYVT